jgi:hypothetical protein
MRAKEPGLENEIIGKNYAWDVEVAVQVSELHQYLMRNWKSGRVSNLQRRVSKVEVGKLPIFAILKKYLPNFVLRIVVQ